MSRTDSNVGCVESSDSDFDNVDIMIEQDATQDISIPLVRSADISSGAADGYSSSSRNPNGAVLMLTSGRNDAEGEDSVLRWSPIG